MPYSDRSANPHKSRPTSRSAASSQHKPVQLELFGARPPAAGRPAPPPSPQTSQTLPPHPRSAPPAPPSPPKGRITAAEAQSRRTELVSRFELLRRLNRFTGGKVAGVSLHDNRRTILTVRAERQGALAPLQLRIHRSFTEAPEEVLQAVAEFVQSRKGSPNARQALGVIREHFQSHRPAARKRPALQSLGECFDLQEILDDLNQRYFEGRIVTEVTWGRAARAAGRGCRSRRGTTTIQLGSFSYEENLVRVNRALDDPLVPRCVVEAVVYHELLHADMPPVTINGRQHFHTPEFRRRERLFRPLAKADAWLEANLPRLLFPSRAKGDSGSARSPRR